MNISPIVSRDRAILVLGVDTIFHCQRHFHTIFRFICFCDILSFRMATTTIVGGSSVNIRGIVYEICFNDLKVSSISFEISPLRNIWL